MEVVERSSIEPMQVNIEHCNSIAFVHCLPTAA